MRFLSLKRLGMLALLVIAVGLLIFITTHAQVNAAATNVQTNGVTSPNWSLAEAASSSPALVVTPPPAAQEPCLSCHILGQNKGLWTPIARWILFGGLGLVFILGVYRSASTWVTRSPWKSFTSRAVEWVDDRYRISDPLSKILRKPVPKYALHWWYCLGGITAFLFVVQGITGILLAFYYKPTPEAAYSSIQYIETQVYLGSAIRAIHHWCANGMIVMCVAHMFRVFIMGAYKKPRELNWVSGMLLLLLTLLFGFTGYLLPWDQRAFWATTVGSEIAGAVPAIGNLALVFLRVGWNVTGETLSRFYGLHVIIVPLATITFMGAHFLMVRRQGIAKPL
jgi:cytochrome b